MIGGGAYGKALRNVMKNNGHEAECYDPNKNTRSLKEVLKGANMMVLAVPSSVVMEAVKDLPKNLPLIVATKGIVPAEAYAGFERVIWLSGAAYASDLNRGEKVRLTVTDKCVAKLFRNNKIYIEVTGDAKGVTLCGALKNVYAILAGLYDLEPETELWWRFLREVANEMRDILELNGAQRETFDLSCGWEDLKITAAPPSRNFAYGQKWRKKPYARQVELVEGLNALEKISEGDIKIPDSAKFMKKILDKYKEERDGQPK